MVQIVSILMLDLVNRLLYLEDNLIVELSHRSGQLSILIGFLEYSLEPSFLFFLDLKALRILFG